MSKKDYMLIGEIVAAVIFLLVLLWAIYCKVEQQSIVLIITAGVVFWYAWETRQMRRTMVYQTRIHATPLIHVYIKSGSPTGATRHKCWAKNVGEGTAIKIEFSALNPFQGQTPIFKEIEALPKGDELPLEIKKIKTAGGETSGEIQETNFLQTLMVFSLQGEVSFKLRFRNILNDPMEYELTFRNDEFITKVP